MHVAASMRSLINTVSQPNTPDEIIFRERSQLNNVSVCKYFQVVAVRMGEKKRQALASSLMINVQRVPVTEIAICLGAADHPHRATYYFYLRSTHKVVVRRNFTKLNDIIPDFCQHNPLYMRVLNPTPALTEPFLPQNTLQGQSLQTSPTIATTQRLSGHHSDIDDAVYEETEPIPPIDAPLVTTTPVSINRQLLEG